LPVSAVADALIIGAGPGGLSAAIALRQAGVEVEVAEVTPDRSAVLSSELILGSPNLRTLDRLGVVDGLVSSGVPIPHVEIHAADDTLVAEVAINKVTREELPPGLGIFRRALHDGLYERALELGANIHFSSDLRYLRQEDDHVEAVFGNGPSGRYELAVGADGSRSQVRGLVFDAPGPAYVGQCVWRARMPREGEAEHALWHGEGAMGGYMPVSADSSFLFCLTTYDTPPRLDPKDFARLMRQDLGQFDNGLIGRMREDLTEETLIHFAQLKWAVTPDPWYRGGVLLIGDAAHATTPHVGYGAGLAIEDGVVLGEEIGAAESLETALANFMERRYERCRRVVEGGAQLSRWQQDPDDRHSVEQSELLDELWSMLDEPI
jgi:2-polyprenyl-6-methoxyphenol hydroxylase-like FAD-dependent oxidoreductase